VPGKDHLACLRVEIGKIARRRAQQNVALLDLGEAEVVQDFGDREKVVDLELQGAGDFRQIRLAVIGRRSDGLDQTGYDVGRDGRQSAANPTLQ
jgi:hypothetical protein